MSRDGTEEDQARNHGDGKRRDSQRFVVSIKNLYAQVTPAAIAVNEHTIRVLQPGIQLIAIDFTAPGGKPFLGVFTCGNADSSKEFQIGRGEVQRVYRDIAIH